MANTQLNHKVRNPKDLSKWMTIWSADITNGTTYTITPSSNWKVPISLIDWSTAGSDTTTLPSNVRISVSQITGDNITGSGTSGYIATFNGDNSIANGPQIKSNGSATNFLNEKGEWATAVAAGDKLEIDSDGKTLSHETVSSNEISVGPVGAMSGKTINLPTIIFDKWGHISAHSNDSFTVTGFVPDSFLDSSKTKIDGSKVSTLSPSSYTNTWDPNTKDDAGYVAAGSGQVNKVWKTDADGVPAWRDDADTWTANSSSAAGYVAAAGTSNASKVWRVNSSGNPGWGSYATSTTAFNTNSISVQYGYQESSETLRLPDSYVTSLSLN